MFKVGDIVEYFPYGFDEDGEGIYTIEIDYGNNVYFIGNKNAFVDLATPTDIRKVMEKTMETGKALEIVHAMAAWLYGQYGEIRSPAKNPAEVEEALNTIEDLIVNNFEEAD